MKKIRAATLLVLLGVTALAFLLAPILPLAMDAISKINHVSAGSKFSPDFEDRFAHVPPDWDTSQWYAQQGRGSYKLSGSREQYFNLQSRFYNRTSGAVATGDNAEGTPTSRMSVFSSNDMNEIAAGHTKVAMEGQTWKEADDNAAFVMLDNDDTVNDNRVVLEFKNLTSITNVEASFNNTSFGRYTPADPNNFLVGMPANQNLFINMGANVDLENNSLYSYLQNSNATTADRIYWGRASNGEFQIRGMFKREGYYEFRFNIAVQGTSADRRITMRFGFYVGHVSNYMNKLVGNVSVNPKNMPVFNLSPTTGKPIGDPFSANLMRPEYNNSIKPTNNDRFYYNYYGTFPSIQYNNDRYAVTVSMTDHNKIPQTVPKGGSSQYPEYTFNQLGAYTINTTMLFPLMINGNVVRTLKIPNFASHRYFLDIFGFQAQYWNMKTNPERYDWLGGEDPRITGSNKSVDSDITSRFSTDNDFNINKTSEATMKASADNAIRKLAGVRGNASYPGKLGSVTPVVTNAPIVALRYNVMHAYADSGGKQILSRIAYRKTYASEWSFNTPYGNPAFTDYTVGKPFEAAGEYAVIVYYQFDAAETAGKIYKQVFYFKINDFAAEIMFKVTHTVDNVSVTENVSFADMMGQKLHSSTPVVVYKANGGTFSDVGPFEIRPRLELQYTNFAGIPPAGGGVVENFDPSRQSLTTTPGFTRPTWYGNDGIYTFRVYYGNNTTTSHQPHMDFTVIVDTSPIANFQCYQGSNINQKGLDITNGTNGLKIPNISIFGGGDVTLAWDRKESGVDMRVAKLDFYEFRVGAAINSSQTSAAMLQSQFHVRPALQRSLRIVPTESGFRLGDKLTTSGLYVITILDAAGVETTYLIVIDTTIASFAQNPAVDPTEVNIKNVTTNVGFGREKFVKAVAKANPADFTDKQKYLADFFTEMQGIQVRLNQTTTLPLSTALVNSGFFINDGTNIGFKMQVDRVDISTDTVKYDTVFNRNPMSILNGDPVNRPAYNPLNPPANNVFNPDDVNNPTKHNNHLLTLPLNPTRSHTYFFRLVDRTGNMAEHYVEVNPDVTKGILFEDSVPNIIQSDIISNTATIVQTGKISNRDYLTFSFEQMPRAVSGPDWRVDRVNVAFYPLTFQQRIMERNEDGSIKYEMGEPVYRENNNYPFSDVPEISSAYEGELDDNNVARRIPVNINRAPRTRQGLYVIARICGNVSSLDATEPDGRTNIRNYHFIVDNNPLISNRNFETGITVRFGAGTNVPTARHSDFQRINNARMNPDNDRVLRANTNARVMLPGTLSGDVGSKYGKNFVKDGFNTADRYNTFTILKGNLLVETNTESRTFTSLDITKTVEQRLPESETFVKQNIDQTAVLDLTTSGMYRIAFTDGSGGFSWILGATAPKPPDGNRSEMLVEIIHQGPSGTFALNGRKIPNSTLSTNVHSVRFNDKESDKLTFTYVVHDTSNFLHPVNSLYEDLTTRSITWRRTNGTAESISRVRRTDDENLTRQELLAGRAVATQYTVGAVTFCEVILPLSAPLVQSGDRFDITLTNGLQTRTTELTLDNTPPKHNLNRIAAADTFWSDYSKQGRILVAEGYSTPQEVERIVKTDGTIEIGVDNPLRYPFVMANDFRFTRASGVYAPNGVYSFDTFNISYFEVDSRLSNISGERFFSHADSRFFYEIVGMQPGQNRFFRIVERDEAGNRTDYFVQLRSQDFVDRIDTSGIVEYRARDGQTSERPTGLQITDNFIRNGGIVRGYEMSVANVRDFFANNLFFEFSAGNITVRRLGFNSMIITGASGTLIESSDEATPERFAEAVRQMLAAGRGAVGNSIGDGGSVRFNVNNRFKHAQGKTGGYSWDVRQFTRNTELFGITEIKHFSSDVTFAVDDAAFPSGLRNSENFIFEVYNLSDLSAGPITTRTVFNVRETLVEDKFHEYLIVVTDEFGRAARYAHNGMYGSNMDLRFPSTMSGRIDGDLYVGSGVEVVFSTNAYDLEIYREGVMVFRNGRLMDESLADYILWNWNSFGDTRISLLPEEGEITKWNVISFRRGTNVRWEREFFLYGELPTLRFMNQSGETLHDLGNGGVTSGIVTVSYSFEGLLFNAGVEYTRSWTDANGNERVDWHPISEFVTRYDFTREGLYVLTVTNALGFRSNATRYVFTIDDVTNRSFKVYFDYGRTEDGARIYDELEASPVSYNFTYNGQNLSIPHYFVRDGNGSNVVLLQNCVREHDDFTRPLRIVPTTNSSRDIIGDSGVHNRFAFSDGNTYIYRLISPTTLGEVFLAVTLVSAEQVIFTNASVAFNISWEPSIQQDTTWQGDPRFRVFYQPSYRPDAAVTIGLNRDWVVSAGNVLCVDYFRDDVWLGRLQGGQKLNIHARDYGIYTFRVSDQAGNIQMFGAEKYYTIMNLTRAPLYAIEPGTNKHASIIDGMVYNDGISLGINELPYNAFSGTENFATRMRVFHNDIERTDFGYLASSKDQSRNSFSFTEPGRYRITLTYRLTSMVTITSEYNFIILPSSVPQQSFSFIAPRDTEITSIRLNGNEIRTRFADVSLRQIALSTATGAGEYIVTLRLGADSIYKQARIRTFKVIIRSVPVVNVYATIEYGTSTTDAVELSINPRQLFTAYGDCRVIIMRDNEEVTNQIVGTMGNIALVNEKVALMDESVSKVGQYRVYVASADAKIDGGTVVGTVYYAQGFAITATKSPLGTIIIGILVVMALGAVVFFIRLRMGVRTR